MKRFLGIFRFDFVFYPGVIIFILFLSFIPLDARIRATPFGYYYPLTQGLSSDYKIYLSYMKQGEIQWLIKPPYVTEKSSYTLIHEFFLLWGKLGYLFNIPLPVVFYIAKYTSFALIGIFVYRLVHLLLPRNLRRIGFLLALFGSSLPHLRFSVPGWPLILPRPWWAPIGNAFLRVVAVPHHLFGQAMMLGGVYYWFRFIKHKRRVFLLLACVLQIIGILVFPAPGWISTFSVFVGFLVWSSLQKFNFRKISSFIFSVIVFTLVSLCALLFMKILFSTEFPWRSEFNNQPRYFLGNYPPEVVVPDYLKLFGIFWVFMIPVLLNFFSLNLIWFTVLFLLLSPVILMPLGHYLFHVDSVRLAEGLPYIWLALLVVHGICILRKRFFKRKIAPFFYLGCFLLLLLYSLPSWIVSFNDEKQIEWTTNVYLPADWIRAFRFLDKVAFRHSVVLSKEHVGSIVPMITHLLPFIGEFNHTRAFFHKKVDVYLFFDQKLSKEKAYKWLKVNNISYVYRGWYEADKSWDENSIYLDFLEPIYKDRHITIFRVVY